MLTNCVLFLPNLYLLPKKLMRLPAWIMWLPPCVFHERHAQKVCLLARLQNQCLHQLTKEPINETRTYKYTCLRSKTFRALASCITNVKMSKEHNYISN